ncbi:hypothetical protein LWE61_05340 [Sphingobium sufflavum]|uniref:hypothetical protein n=1 Tax=Sphingobium sufflavum TaxID=1129547 RepID=UPI001F3BC413|nr:hypothetical protein [Sphingobium sufflavum]MCE7795984.1 hypothetical protein [Sphingobium sufflavum]
MIWLPTLLASCLAAELFLHMPIARQARRTLGSCAQAQHVILSRAISDHWKEKVMPAYALRLGRQSLMLAAYFAAFTLLAAATMQGMDRLMPDAARFMGSARGLAAGFLISLLYLMARRHHGPA